MSAFSERLLTIRKERNIRQTAQPAGAASFAPDQSSTCCASASLAFFFFDSHMICSISAFIVMPSRSDSAFIHSFSSLGALIKICSIMLPSSGVYTLHSPVL